MQLENKQSYSRYLGVNQGGNASGFLFRKYMADLSLHQEFAVVVDNNVIAHICYGQTT